MSEESSQAQLFEANELQSLFQCFSYAVIFTERGASLIKKNGECEEHARDTKRIWKNRVRQTGPHRYSSLPIDGAERYSSIYKMSEVEIDKRNGASSGFNSSLPAF